MTTMTIKSVPDDLYERIKESAQKHGRSINNEVIFCLKRAMYGGTIDPEAFLARVAALRQQIVAPPLTDEILRNAKDEERL